MILNIPERILLVDLLPKEGHYADLLTLRKAKETMSLTSEEVKEIQYVERDTADGGKMAFFDTSKAVVLNKEIPIDEWTTNTIKNLVA